MSRNLAGLSWWHLLFLAIFGFLCGMLLYHHLNILPNCFFLTAILILILSLIHVYRSDKTFVSLTGADVQKVFTVEYMVFSLPILVLMFISVYWYCGLIWLIACCGAPFLRFNGRKPKARITRIRFVPSDNFEWLSGIRKNKVYLLVLYSGALASAYYPYAVLFFLWFILTVISSFYIACEPREILEHSELPPLAFIRKKVFTHLKLYCLLSLPIIITSIVFHPETSWIVLAIYLLSFINLSFFILSKYAIYRPAEKLSSNNLIVALVHMTMWVPFLLPLPVLMSWRAYRKALVNLEMYLDAYH